MRLNDKEYLLSIIEGKRMDFYLEDDMFEIEGRVVKKDGDMVVEVLEAVGHVLDIVGRSLRLRFDYKKLYAERLDTGKSFEMEINRVYDLIANPTAEEFSEKIKKGAKCFFRKQSDTLVWREADKWVIELNKINMYFNGDRYYYNSLQELCSSNAAQMAGDWQAVYYSSEPELE